MYPLMVTISADDSISLPRDFDSRFHDRSELAVLVPFEDDLCRILFLSGWMLNVMLTGGITQ